MSSQQTSDICQEDYDLIAWEMSRLVEYLYCCGLTDEDIERIIYDN